MYLIFKKKINSIVRPEIVNKHRLVYETISSRTLQQDKLVEVSCNRAR